MAAASTAERIISAAERRMREGGFHGFSFREIAADVGVKSASVHHHFPTKEDLAAAVMDAYSRRFMDALGDPVDPKRSTADLVAHYVAVCRSALVGERRMCLGGVLATEASALPTGISTAARHFFERNVEWLQTVLKRSSQRTPAQDIRAQALRIVATIEGAMLVAQGLGDVKAFDKIVKGLGEPARRGAGRGRASG